MVFIYELDILSIKRGFMRKRYLFMILGVTILTCFIGLIIAGYLLSWSWTGFGPETSEPKQHAKTLWDWLQLLGVLAIPLAVGFGTIWFTTKQGQVSYRENADNQKEAALQVYIDKISELLLHEKLRDSAEGDEVRKIARVRTLTILPRLDGPRKRSVLQFLYEAGLIENGKCIVNLAEADLREIDLAHVGLLRASLYQVNLSRANLDGANLDGTYLHDANLKSVSMRGAYLHEVDLSGANLADADLRGAFLYGTNLQGAELQGADLREAEVNRANLRKATVTRDQLNKAKVLQSVAMPDSSTYPQ